MGTYKVKIPEQVKKILLLTESFQSLTQKVYVELIEKGFDVSIEFYINNETLKEAINLFQPDLILATYLKHAIPDEIFLNHLCLIIHPGIKGDRGASSIDWAIFRGVSEWGVTVLQADYEWDSGDIWSSYEFPMRFTKKSNIYRNEVTNYAIKAIFDAIEKIHKKIEPEPLDYQNPQIKGRWNEPLRQELRRIDWENDTTDTILRKIYASDGAPGVLDFYNDKFIYLFNSFKDEELAKVFKNVKPGEWIASRDHALCRKTTDGSIWITHLIEKKELSLKLPSSYVLPEVYEKVENIPLSYSKVPYTTFQEIYYEIEDDIGFLYFEFYNGAMSTEQCIRLKDAYRELKTKEIRFIILMGGEDFWSNGIHLNIIEHAESPSWESWNNINAMNDLCKEIIKDLQHITIAVMRGNAGAGGVFFALACDFVYAKKGIILNPHYKSMGNLYGSEYWTYLLPKRVSKENYQQILENRLPISTTFAKHIGLIDDELEGRDIKSEIKNLINHFKNESRFSSFLEQKRKVRLEDELKKPLDEYRKEELSHMHRNFFGFDPSYHIARYYFLHKIRNFRTPLYLAKHRSLFYTQ